MTKHKRKLVNKTELQRNGMVPKFVNKIIERTITQLVNINYRTVTVQRLLRLNLSLLTSKRNLLLCTPTSVLKSLSRHGSHLNYNCLKNVEVS